ncbi:DUF874 domain-containing protein [Sulfitobacter sp. SK012]|uniref:GumC family protein n=1 Tax=Sulfitobacter sp. SK012 TaxID=1389005 RepID=UPI000E0C24F2|nr:DUF874 domain-containing protein [Sulfitobacter sp. SK012]AXI45930.1 DUF874 domain-containing protein [Sulfitobacter sp. SK012]
MGPIYSWNDFLDMTRRRMGLILFVILLGCMISLVLVLRQVPVYRSSEVIQIEQPKITDDLARSTVAGSSARRLQLIEQRLMARGNVLKIIDKFELFGTDGELNSVQKVDLLRRAVSIAGVAAVREGFADDGAIAVLTISAEMPTPELAQAIAHEFANQTRELSITRRREQTAQTLEFFEEQQKALTAEISQVENELELYRIENNLSVTGGVDFRMNEIASLNASILELDRGIIAAQLARTQIDRAARPQTVARADKAIVARLETLQSQRELLDKRRGVIRQTIQGSPEVESDLSSFERRIDRLQTQLDLVSARKNQAEVGFSLESGSQGERMITIEEAVVPEYPISSSRKRRAAMGGIASGILAFVLAWVLELRNPVIRTARQMQRETGLMPVVAIPELKTRRFLLGRDKRRLAAKQRKELQSS